MRRSPVRGLVTVVPSGLDRVISVTCHAPSSASTAGAAAAVVPSTDSSAHAPIRRHMHNPPMAVLFTGILLVRSRLTTSRAPLPPTIVLAGSQYLGGAAMPPQRVEPGA